MGSNSIFINNSLLSLSVFRLKVAKEQLPIITTSAEADEVPECVTENGAVKGGNVDQTADRSKNGLRLDTEFPNFHSALQIKDELLVNRPEVVNRPIYPNIPYSPYSSPRTVRRRSPLKESRRVSIDECGSYQQLNQYKLIDSIGQVSLMIFNIIGSNFIFRCG